MILTHAQRPRLAILASLMFFGAAAGQTAQVLPMRALVATCANCHGTEGAAIQGEAMPRLAGLLKDYLVTQMQSFREGKRPATVMHQISEG